MNLIQSDQVLPNLPKKNSYTSLKLVDISGLELKLELKQAWMFQASVLTGRLYVKPAIVQVLKYVFGPLELDAILYKG